MRNPISAIRQGLAARRNADPRTGLFSRLQRDSTANVLAMTAAAIVPMIALTGSAIDISRVYLARNRLQAACDAGVLAGRKAMSTVTYTSTAQARAEAMFAFNYDDADYNSVGSDFSAQANSSGKLDGEASTSLPMLVMDIVGFDDQDISVECSADIQVPNIDIVFVLDVTGSMDEYIGSTKKIDSLKTATISFYDTITAAMAGNTTSRVRYGFVPYSQAVNGSELFVSSPNFDDYGQLSRSHLIDIMSVQSRVANFNTVASGSGYTPWEVDPAVPAVHFNQTFNSGNADSKEPNVAASPTGTVMSNNDCAQYSANLSFSIDNSTNLRVWFPLRTSWPGDAGIGNSVLYRPGGSTTWQATEPTTGTSYVKATFSRVSGTWTDNNGSQTSKYKACTRKVTHTTYRRTAAETRYKFTNWTYRPVDYNVTNFAAGTPITYVSSINTSTATVETAGSYSPVQLAQQDDLTGMSTSTTSWNGCLEERTTTAASTFAPIPEAAKDLDYLTGGTSTELRWRPMLRELTYLRSGSSHETTSSDKSKPGTACPSVSMRNLREYSTRSNFTSYVNSLSPNGYTYLDVGMVWGLRMIAQQGMFTARNLTGPNGGQISRHIIFLTDGAPVSQSDTYTSYGTEQMDKRITGTTGENAATLHARRFQALCDAERGRVSIWAIAFGTSVTGNMQNCADSGRALQANNTAELNSAFQRIASEVADLRLVQ